MKRCAICKAKAVRVTAPDTLDVGEQTFRADVPAWKCTSCGEVFYPSESVRSFEFSVADVLAQSGASSGEAFRFMRKVLGLRANELADLLGVVPDTISRWEKGKRPVDRGAMLTLGSLVDDQFRGRSTTLERLTALQKPARAAKSVRIELRHVAIR